MPRSAAAMPLGAVHPRISKRRPAAFGLPSVFDDWTDPATLNAMTGLQRRIDGPAESGLAEVRR
jgi:hypothetical protein